MAGGEPRRTDLGVRSASAVIMLAVSGAALWLGGWTWTLFLASLAVVLLWEWRVLVRGFKVPGPGRMLWNAGGFVYIAVAAVVLLFLRNQPGGAQVVLLVLGAVVATDVGAYFAGRTIGGPKIAPRISPSKTWAGLLGGMAGATLFVWAGVRHLMDADWSASLVPLLLSGPLIAIVAQAGDFFESWMKRRAGVKDSSNLIPGHGGVLDRLDGLLAVLFLIGLWGLILIFGTLATGGSLLPSPA